MSSLLSINLLDGKREQISEHRSRPAFSDPTATFSCFKAPGNLGSQPDMLGHKVEYSLF